MENGAEKEMDTIMARKCEKMQRVSRNSPCPICEKPDWCLVAEDGSAAICQRIQEGSVKQCGDAGWLHVLSNRHNSHKGDRSLRLISSSGEKPKDFSEISRQYQQQLTEKKLRWLSIKLGVSTQSLKRLRIGWDGQAYAFPMSDAEGQIIGIRRRFPDGRKLCVSGSRTGLFIPKKLSGKDTLLICEGESDTAAALDLAFSAIGRPNCTSCVDMTADFVKGREVVIIGDNDDGGRFGVERLSDTLVLYCKDVRIVYPPEGIKDLRQWFQAGLTGNQLRQIIEDTKPLTMELSR